MRSLFLTLIELLIDLYERVFVSPKVTDISIDNLKLKKNLYMKRVKQIQRVIIDYDDPEISDVIVEYEEGEPWKSYGEDIWAKVIKFNNLFPDKLVVLGQMKKHSIVPIHRHTNTQEEIYIISGSVTDTVTNLVTNAGESYLIPADSPHEIVATEDTCLIASFTNVQ